MALQSSDRLHFIDGLRAIAVLLVLFHHTFGRAVETIILVLTDSKTSVFFVSYLTGSGVELFFCISGIVLIRPYLTKHRPFYLFDYVRRRAQRIYPPYVAALIIAGLVYIFKQASDLVLKRIYTV